jgi:hypothetical protein
MSAPDRNEAYQDFYNSNLARGDKGHLWLNATSVSSFNAGWDAAMNRADLCDPMQDERVKALVEAIEEHATHTLNGEPAGAAMRKMFAALAALRDMEPNT